jgi:hypothetical protein
MDNNKTNYKATIWDSFTPRELRNIKNFCVFFVIVALLILILFSKIIGSILLAVGVFFGASPFILSSKRSINNMVYVLKSIEPGYSSWNDAEIAEQIKAILKCGYKWEEQKGLVGFKHSKTGLYLKIDGLHIFSPEDIEKTYREVWSKANVEQLAKREEAAQRLYDAILNNDSDQEIESLLNDDENLAVFKSLHETMKNASDEEIESNFEENKNS